MSDEHRLGGVDEPLDPAGRDLPSTVVERLRDPAVWAEPRPGLGEAIVEAIDLERSDGAALTSTTGPLRRPPPATGGRRAPRWALAAAAVAVAAVAAVVIVIATGDDPDDEAGPIAIAGTELAPDASASATVIEDRNGVAIRVRIEGLPAAPGGSYYQGWVRSAEGERVSIGTFHMRGGDGLVTLWSGVDLDDYPTMSVTLQREGAGPESSGEIVLQGDLTP